jgi:hypothetical protein
MQNSNNASNDREFLGLTQNECTFQGKVVGDPIITGDNYAFMQLKVGITEQDPNGQWVESATMIPIMTTDPSKVATIANYIKDGRTLLIHSYYKPWVNQGTPQHAFMIKKIDFGPKKYNPNAAAETPSLPVS